MVNSLVNLHEGFGCVGTALDDNGVEVLVDEGVGMLDDDGFNMLADDVVGRPTGDVVGTPDDDDEAAVREIAHHLTMISVPIIDATEILLS